MKLLIGCPIYKREWILENWIRCIKTQHFDHSSIGFIFETSADDVATNHFLENWKKFDKVAPYFEIIVREDLPHFEHDRNSRQWTLSKYENMVNLRNSLLAKVREIAPDYYFSLDSDILLENPNTLELLIAHIKEGADAVNPLMFMTPFGDMYPSVMTWSDPSSSSAMRLPRYPIGKYFKADVIMAAKMMSKPVYENVDYHLHHQGEDVGWSWACRESGYNLFCASYLYAPHIMSPDLLHNYITNGDDRDLKYSLEQPMASI